ncbi:MAG: glycosyltransferase family 9 protein [Candidatus Peribacteraceae bacterium]|jgi:ADP-heptose:LPS heptosyltransferase
MSYEIVNQANGKALSISRNVAQGFFGATHGEKKIMCLPISEEVSAGSSLNINVYEVREFVRQKKIPGTLVIRMGGLGDLAMLSSGLREMVRRGEKVTVATLPQYTAFMLSLGIACRVIKIQDIGRFKFDKVIDLRFAVEPKELGQTCKGTWTDYTTKDRSDSFDELLGVYPARKMFEVPVSTVALKKVDALLSDLKGLRVVAVNACMVASARSIPPKYVRPLCRKLANLGLGVVLFGSSQSWNRDLKDLSVYGTVNLIDRTELDEMIALLSLSDVVVTPDTGSLHIAAALGKPTVALFGNINPRTRCSYYPTVRPIYPVGEIKCVPCWDLHPCSSDPGKSVKCMELITPDRITNAVKETGGFK